MSKIKIFIDMDGVLAKWDTTSSVEDTYKSGYFLFRQVDEKIKALLEMIDKCYDVSILSSVYSEGTAKADKADWLRLNKINKIDKIFCPYGHKKTHWVDHIKPSILIDDFSKNLREWESVPGFVGVKYYNGINGTNGTWNGYSINHRMSPEEMFGVIENVAENLVGKEY